MFFRRVTNHSCSVVVWAVGFLLFRVEEVARLGRYSPGPHLKKSSKLADVIGVSWKDFMNDFREHSCKN
jgi:hypothetical protein